MTQVRPDRDETHSPIEVGPYENHDAEQTSVNNRRMSIDRAIRVGLVAVIALFLVIATFIGLFVRSNSNDYWSSLIWWLPVALVVLPLIIGVLRRRAPGRILWALVISIVAAVILFLVIMLVKASGFADDWFAAIFGNETMGSLGWVKWFESLGWVQPFAAIGWIVVTLIVWVIIALPLVCAYQAIQSLSFEEHFSILGSLLWTVAAGFACVFPIGHSIIMNSGL